MTRAALYALTLLAGFAIGGLPALTLATEPVAAEATTAKKKIVKKKTKKKVTTNYNRPRPKKRDYYGYPEEPNPAGMSDYCAFEYNIYHRRGVGCNRFGHDFMFDD
jgi:hypothetical protein